MCTITYRGVAVSTPEGRTTVSYDTAFLVHKELLSQVLNTVLRVRERDSRQVGDPFITPYLAGVYQRLGLEYSSLLGFTRLNLLWRRIATAKAAAAAAAPAAAAGSAAAAPGEESGSTSGGSREAAGAEAAAAAAASACPAARVASVDWHVQQLHRELVLEPWKAADLRLMLGRAAAYAEVQMAAGAPAAAGAAGACSSAAGAGGSGSGGGGGSGGAVPGPWLPRHGSALAGGGMRVGVYAGGGGGGGGTACGGTACGGVQTRGPPGGALDSALFWLLWLVCPTMLVALEAMQAAPDNSWMALYICIVATCRTVAEWRATAAMALAPGLAPSQRLYGLASAHLASALACALVTGLLNTWMPLLGHGGATAVVWLHLLLLPAVMVAVMGVAGMPVVARQLAGGVRTGRSATQGSHRRSGGLRDRRLATAAAGDDAGIDVVGGVVGGALAATADPRAPPAVRRAVRDGDRAGGGGGGRSSSAASAAVAQVHWPPALDVPAWLDDWPNAPEAFRCPITQSLMREPAQASSGVTYERPAILQWLDHRRMDPVTHVPLKRHRLAPNLNLRHMIEVWVQDRVEARRRLAQRLRDEVSADVAAAAAAAAELVAVEAPAATAGGSGSCSGDGTGEDPSVVDAAPPAAQSHGSFPAQTGAAAAETAAQAPEAAAPGQVPAATSSAAVVTGAPASGPAAAATAVRGSAEGGGEAVTEAAASTAAIRAATTSAGDYTSASVDRDDGRDDGAGGGGRGDGVEGGGKDGSGGRGSELVIGTSSGAVQMQVAEVEAMALAAARARVGYRRHFPAGPPEGGCSSSGRSRSLFSSCRGGGGGGGGGQRSGSVLEPGYGWDDPDGDVSTAGSGESPFAAAVGQGSTDGGEGAETDQGADVAGTRQQQAISNARSSARGSL